MRFAEGKMEVINGRELTKEDSASKSDVCLVSREFASKNNLKIGDKISLKLGTQLFEQYKGLEPLQQRVNVIRLRKNRRILKLSVYTRTLTERRYS
jgi:hypothetical protein